MREKARLIIPSWGESYARKLTSITLPAILAPGNLPALAQLFEVDLMLVTERRLFDLIRESRAFEEISKICCTQLVPIDDLMTDVPGDYGVVLTHALFRGFADLGPKMTDTYLLFLNADFVIADGSLRHLGNLLQRGERVVHAPSFRVVLEDVWPQLETRVDSTTASLIVSPREMAKVALLHKHVTVKARTVNQRLCHQLWMDQFYWYVNESTLIGYQWPVALVAIKPERVVTEPVLVWDYGFIPEAAPTMRRHFIGDSDDFFMIEPQRRTSGEEQVRLGWISQDAIARNLSTWTTKEQRECGEQLLLIHSGDLPSDIDQVIEESREYMAGIFERLDPTPQSHIGHAWLGDWFEQAKQRMKRRNSEASIQARGDSQNSVTYATGRPGKFSLIIRPMREALARTYAATFGRVPRVGRYHPLWIDTHAPLAELLAWQSAGKEILWITSGDSLFHRLLSDRVDPAALVTRSEQITHHFDACFCELSIDELAELGRLYARIRRLLKDGGDIVVYVFNKGGRELRADNISFCDAALPDLDVSEARFFGSRLSAFLRDLFFSAAISFQNRPFIREILTALVLVAFAPVVRLANAHAQERDTVPTRWTSLMMRFQVRKGPPGTRPEPSASATRVAEATPQSRYSRTAR